MTQRSLQLMLSKTLIATSIVGFIVLLTGCTPKPEPFKTGAEVTPPYGCIEYRKRGGEC